MATKKRWTQQHSGETLALARVQPINESLFAAHTATQQVRALKLTSRQ